VEENSEEDLEVDLDEDRWDVPLGSPAIRDLSTIDS